MTVKISFHYELDFQLENEDVYIQWIERILSSEGFEPGEISYIFCSDTYLAELHKKYLKQDSLTDIITFDYTEGSLVSGDIFISLERVRDNAGSLGIKADEEMLRVMSHGLLHMMGYKDKSDEDSMLMRNKEEEKMRLFHVEQ